MNNPPINKQLIQGQRERDYAREMCELLNDAECACLDQIRFLAWLQRVRVLLKKVRVE